MNTSSIIYCVFLLLSLYVNFIIYKETNYNCRFFILPLLEYFIFLLIRYCDHTYMSLKVFFNTILHVIIFNAFLILCIYTYGLFSISFPLMLYYCLYFV